MALWKHMVKTPTGIVEIPIVRYGESPLPSKLKTYKAGVGYGEVPLVYPDDVRASKIRVRQDGVTYSVAFDERVSIVYPQSPELRLDINHQEGLSGGYDFVLTKTQRLGTTTFNRVTRIEAEVMSGVGVTCLAKIPTTPIHHGESRVFLRLSGPRNHETPKLVATVAGNHALFTDFSGSDSKTGVVAVDVDPGRYTVDLVLELRCFQSAGISHPGVTFVANARLYSWTEIARG